MFDGLKMSFRDQQVVKKLHHNTRLEFVQHTNVITGEVLNFTAEYRGLKIKTFNSGLVEIQGSLHKYFNEGFHNCDDFTYTKLTQAIEMFKNDLDIDPLIARINNLEFGVNLNTSFAPAALINAILCYKWKPFDSMQIIGQGMGKECKSFKQYFVKIYDKGTQYRQSVNILRIEKKIVKMCALKFGTICLTDLTNPGLWNHCSRHLLEMIDEVLINEPISLKSLKKNEQRIYHKVVNQSKWIDYSRDQRKRYKMVFNRIISTHGNARYRQAILKLTAAKCLELRET